jgi:radical SAM superfamily enzyme YgiQ (UPF0313 family)
LEPVRKKIESPMANAHSILFVFPPAPGSAGAFRDHLGVAYLRASLARDGIATSQYVNENPGTIDAVAADIIRQKSPIVGFTVYDANARLSIAIAQSIKGKNPGTKIVFGGPTATFNARPLMERHAAIDVCVIGEAEETGAQIFTKLLHGSVFDDAQSGIAFRRDGEVICTALPPLVGSHQRETKGVPGTTAPGVAFVPVGEVAGAKLKPIVGWSRPWLQGELDFIPSPYLSGILSDGREGILTGRGCTHHCQFCCFAALARNRLRLHSIERVVAELECIAEHQKRTGSHYPVTIYDDAFTLVPPRAKALCQAIADRKLKLVLSCITRADTVDEELIRLMREAGFRRISFGLESAVPSVLRAIGKVRPPDWYDPDLNPERQFIERVKNSVLLAKKYGFSVAVSIILGLPTEIPTDGAETIRFVKKLPVDSYAHNFLNVYLGTPLWTTHDKFRIRCEIDKTGLPETTEHSYDLRTIKPGPKDLQRDQANLVRLLATDALYSCDASSAVGKGIGTVIIQRGDLSPETAGWLRRILAVGGIVVQVYPAMNRSERWLRFNRDRRVMREHLVPFQHYIQVESKNTNSKNGDDENWGITSAGVDVYHIHQPALLSIKNSAGAAPLIAWAKCEETKAAACEISGYLQQPQELVQIMGRIEREGTPSPLQRMPFPPQVKYAGRWLRGTAPCLSLKRIEISSCGKVRCCCQGEPIGKVGDSRGTLSKRLSQLADAVEQRRGCAKCQNMHCPRCTFPGVHDRTYCEIMTEQEPALRLLDWIRFYSRVPLLLDLQRLNLGRKAGLANRNQN